MLRLKRILTPPLTVIVAILLWLEEWLWELLKLVASWVARLLPLHWYEAFLTRLPPYGALVAFLVPGLLLLPVKLAAVWLIVHVHAGLGLLVVLAAKVLGTTLFTRTFVLCKPQLMTIPWFAWLYNTFEQYRQRIYQHIRSMPLYQRVRAILTKLREQARSWLRRHFMRAGALLRRWRAVRRALMQRKTRQQPR